MANVMPSGAMETFTGANGSAPNAVNITQTLNEGSGGGLSIQSNALRLRTGTVQANRTSFRLTGVSIADVEVVFTWTVASGIYGQFMLRAASNVDTGNGYLLSLVQNDMTLGRHVAYSGPNLQTVSHSFDPGDKVKTRAAIFGQTIYARTWLSTNPEPTSTWQLVYTDLVASGGISAAGFVGWTASSASAGSKDLVFDDIDAYNTLTPTVATLVATGSIAPAATLTKTPAKIIVGSITPVGTLTRMKVVARSFIATITPAGALVRRPAKSLAGTVIPASILVRRPAKVLAGTVTPAGLVRRSMLKRFTGSIAPAGLGVALFIGRIFGRPGLAVMSLIQRAEVRIRARKG